MQSLTAKFPYYEKDMGVLFNHYHSTLEIPFKGLHRLTVYSYSSSSTPLSWWSSRFTLLQSSFSQNLVWRARVFCYLVFIFVMCPSSLKYRMFPTLLDLHWLLELVDFGTLTDHVFEYFKYTYSDTLSSISNGDIGVAVAVACWWH